MKFIPISLLIMFMMIQNLALSQKTAVYYDESKSTDVRVKDLIAKMTLEEKVFQMMHAAPAIPRLGVPAYNWWNEALHGVARAGNATVFPQAIGLAATFDEHLILQTSIAISDEARAMYNAAIAKDNRIRYAGLTFWTPNINIFRDPRWGRGQETYGEDPFLTSRLGLNFVKGLQGDNPKYLKVAACAKHFAVHSGPERLRHVFDAEVNKKDLYETYLPAFKTLVEGGVESVMCAYNRTNSEPCCGSKELLVDILRNDWKFKGHVVSDCWAITDIDKGHKFTLDPVESAALSLKKGVNLNCGEEYTNLIEAVKRGLVTEEEVNQSLAVLLKTRFKLGMFDKDASNPYNSIPQTVINSDAHRKIALKAAQESIVLLKNNGILPLKKDIGYLFITGPNATSVDALLGDYYGVNQNMVTIQEGIASHLAHGSSLQYKQGFLADRDNVNPFDWTSGDAKDADAIIVSMGLTVNFEGEEGEAIASPSFGDRLDYNLPKNQIDFLKKLRKGNKKPIIVIINSGSPVNMSEIQELADAVIWAWYPGEEGGNAVADIIFGKVSPSGRLPITFPKSFDQLPDYENYDMQGRTYRFMKAEPFYPFGYGLSYTTFTYDGLKISSNSIKKGSDVQIEASIKNEGKYSGDEVVQLYIKRDIPQINTPIYALKGFKRVHINKGDSLNVHFTVSPEMMSIVNNDGKTVLESGKVKIFIGGSLPDERSKQLGMSKVLEGSFIIQ